MKKQHAFTLAETLITLLILGIIAAMTIPALMTKINKHVVEVKLKEDYSILQQAMMKANNDVPFNPKIADSLEGMKEWTNKYFLPYVKVEKICYNEKGCWQSKGPTYSLANNVAGWNVTGKGVGADIITIRLSNGTNLCFDGHQASTLNSFFGVQANSDGLVIYIDANGDNPPNIIGKDIYIVAFTSQGLVPAGNDVSQAAIDKNCSKNAAGNNAGYYCLKKVQQNGWEISDEVWNK